jgi:hypothetical protein
VVVFVLAVVAVAVVFPGAGAQDPGEPVNIYGSAVDEAGNQIPAGTTIYAVVDGEMEDSLTVEEAGTVGGPDTFDERLVVNTGAGESVSFTIDGVDGPEAFETVDLDEASGAVEVNLTFPGETFAGSVELAGLSLSLAETTLTQGETTAATVNATFADGTESDVTDAATVESLDPAVASVENGSVVGESAGTATIQATYTVDGTTETDTAELTVDAESAELTGITLDLERSTVATDETTMATVTAMFSNGSEADVTDSAAVESSDGGIATVEGDTVTGQSTGTVTLTADYEGASDSTELTVEAAGQSLFEVTALEAPATAVPGESLTVSVSITNAGDAAGTATVTYEFAGTEKQQTLALGAGDTGTLTFSAVAPDTEGDAEHSVLTATDSNTATTTVGSEDDGTDDDPDDDSGGDGGADDGGDDDGGADDGGADDGGADDGGADDGGADDGGADDGGADDGGADDGGADDGGADDGGTDDGGTDDGGADDGETDDGGADDGGDDGGADDGGADDGGADDSGDDGGADDGGTDGGSADDGGTNDGSADDGADDSADDGDDGFGSGFGILVALCALLGLVAGRLRLS